MQKILIIEDEIKIREELSSFLKNNGYEVLIIDKFENTLADILKMDADLILMDTKLPILDGLDAMYKIRDMLKISQPRIIFCSGMTDVDHIKEALDGEADDYIMKPFDEEIIISKLEILDLV